MSERDRPPRHLVDPYAGTYRSRNTLGPSLGFWVFFAACGVLGSGVLGVGIWAVIRLVNHYT